MSVRDTERPWRRGNIQSGPPWTQSPNLRQVELGVLVEPKHHGLRIEAYAEELDESDSRFVTVKSIKP